MVIVRAMMRPCHRGRMVEMASVDEALRGTSCHPFDVISQSFTIRGQKTPFVHQVGKRGLHWLLFSLLICKYDECIFDGAMRGAPSPASSDEKGEFLWVRSLPSRRSSSSSSIPRIAAFAKTPRRATARTTSELKLNPTGWGPQSVG